MGPLVGPLVAVVSFVCSIGNVPLAVVLWTGGIKFGGVVAFIFADLIILPILDIYRRYYGWRMAALLCGSFFLTAAVAGYVVEILFGALGAIPDRSRAHLPDEGISWNYTTWLNIAFLVLAVALVWRFWRTGGMPMLRMMGGSRKTGCRPDAPPRPRHAAHALSWPSSSSQRFTARGGRVHNRVNDSGSARS